LDSASLESAGDAKLRTFSGRNNFRPRASRLDTNRFLEEQGLSSHVFMTERDGPMTPKAFHALFGRIGARVKMQFPIHPHMLWHGCGYALANAGHDTRALQAWLGHKNIQHTVRYTELSPHRFKDFWR
jgi:site-specific recombinase XerD